jgi:uroporphyrinogen decarboxylase
MTDINDARRRVGTRVALQGNLDPMILMSNPESIRRETGRILEAYGQGSGHVFNLGHGISRFTPPDHARAFVDAVHQLSVRYH